MVLAKKAVVPPRPAATSAPRREQLAVNVFDLGRVEPRLRAVLLAGKLELDRDRIVRTDPDDLGEAAAPFACDLLSAAVACDLLRAADREAGRPPARVYLKRSGSWARLPAGVVLTAVDGAGRMLDPATFPPAASFSASSPKVVKVV